MQHGFGLGGKQNSDEGIGMTKQLASIPREGGASSLLSFQTFFHETTGNLPYGYQCRLAETQTD